MLRTALLTVLSFWLLIAPTLAQEEPPAAPVVAQSNDTLLLAIVALVLPVTTLLINFFSTRASAEQARTIATQAKTIDALIVKLDGLPVRLAEVIANAALKGQFADALQEALIKLGIPVSEQPKEIPQQPLTPLKPPGLLQELELDKLDRDAAAEAPDVPSQQS